VKVAVVGAGIAGLNATYLLAQAGVGAVLYEASDHIGGRIQTNYGDVAPGVAAELGGEFIDSGHEDMLALASRFGFGLIDAASTSEEALDVAYYARGRLRSEPQVIDAFRPLARMRNPYRARMVAARSQTAAVRVTTPAPGREKKPSCLARGAAFPDLRGPTRHSRPADLSGGR
jgi:protoporphyrinogen oxidase